MSCAEQKQEVAAAFQAVVDAQQSFPGWSRGQVVLAHPFLVERIIGVLHALAACRRENGEGDRADRLTREANTIEQDFIRLAG